MRRNEAVCCAVTPEEVSRLVSFVESDVKASVKDFCDGLGWVARLAGASGCDVIMAGGAIPVIADCLKRWITDEDVVFSACAALSRLASFGSEPVKLAVKSLPDIKQLLTTAKETKRSGDAAVAMRILAL